MSDELRKIYGQQNLLPCYFDKTVPADLFRGQSRDEAKKDLPIIYPIPVLSGSMGKHALPML